MKPRSLAVGWLLLAALALAAGAGPVRLNQKKGKKPARPAAKAPRGKVYRTPQQAFDAFHASLNKGDFRTHVGCMSPELRKQQAVSVALARILDRRAAQSSGDAERLKLHKPVFDALDAHGLTAEAVKDVKGESDERDLLALIKDPGDFLVAMLAAADKAEPRAVKPASDLPRLTNVQISQDRAKGVSVENRSGREAIDVVEFVKAGDSWKVAAVPPRTRKEPKKEPGRE